MRPLPDELPEVAVRGITFRARKPEAMTRLCKVGTLVELRREPANPHDANAVAVDVDGVGHVGYVAARIAARLAPELDAGTDWAGIVTRVFDPARGDRGHGLRLDLWRQPDDDTGGSAT